MALVAPFREGGRDPLGLLLLHTLALLYVAGALARAPRSEGIRGTGAPDPFVFVAFPAGAALVLACVSALGAAYPLAAGLGAWDLAVPCVLFASAARSDPTERDLSRLSLAVIISTAGQAILAVARYPRGGAMAAGASFLNPNHLAAFLNIGFFLCVAAAAAPAARPRARLLWGLGASGHVLAMSLLESRGAFLALLAGLLVFGARDFRRWTPRVRLATVVLIGLCTVTAGLALRERFGRAVDPYRYHRLAIWKASLGMIEERPLLGHGPGNFPYVSPAHNFPAGAGPVRYGRTFHGAHSAYLTLMAEVGVPGVLCFAAAAFACLLALLKKNENACEAGGIMSGTGLALLALLVQGAVEDLNERPALALVPALLAGTALGVLRGRSLRPAPAPRLSRPARLVMATAAVYLFLMVVLLPYLAYREAQTARRLGREGLPLMRRATALNPLQPEYHHDLAMAILNSGPLSPEGFAEVQSRLLEAERLKPIDYRFPLLRARLEARFATRLFDDRMAKERAVGLYGRAVRLAPLDPRPQLELAGHLVDLGRPDVALEVLKEGLRLEPDFVRARILEASILLDLGRRGEARTSLEAVEATLATVSAHSPDSSYAREILADARSERKRLAAALDGPAAAGELRFR
jgi:O-antigen ligase